MWLGPAPYVPYNENRCLYKFRWFFDYSSQTANWGAHYIDMLHWFTGMNGPVKISAIGGNYAVKDNRTIPDTMEVTYEYPDGLLATFGIYKGATRSQTPPFGALFTLYCILCDERKDQASAPTCVLI